jgi:hypothetical protein
LEKLVEPPLTLGVEILNVAWDHRGHVAPDCRKG